jgi:hypothetical protein
MYANKEPLIQWLNYVADEYTQIDKNRNSYFLRGIIATFEDVFELQAMSEKLREFHSCILNHNIKEMRKIIEDIDKNWDSYTDIIMNKLIN